MPFNPLVTANTDYWFDKSIPDAGKIMAEYGHIIDVCLLTPEQRLASSTLRELLGLIRMVRVHLFRWTNHCVRLFVDNQAVEKFMVKGSRIMIIHQMVRDLLVVVTLDKHNIRVSVIWIPRKENYGGDKMSR